MGDVDAFYLFLNLLGNFLENCPFLTKNLYIYIYIHIYIYIIDIVFTEFSVTFLISVSLVVMFPLLFLTWFTCAFWFFMVSIILDWHLIIYELFQRNNFCCSSLFSEAKVTQSCPTLCDPMDYTVQRNFPGQNTGEWVAFLFSRGSSQIEGSNPGLLYCRWILYQLGQKGSQRILEWVAYPFSSRSSWPRNRESYFNG